MTVVIRRFQANDAQGISALFRTVYGDRYVYPEVYLPSVIRHHNQCDRWKTLVAVEDGRIVGHATLWRQPTEHPAADSAEQAAEIAMFVVHPSARGRGVATSLGRQLCEDARRHGLQALVIKMVSSHRRSQQLARRLGFHTTGLLMDYVSSPFGQHSRESVVLGVLPLQARPIPVEAACGGAGEWIDELAQRFGARPFPSGRASPTHAQVSTHDDRLDVTLDSPTSCGVEEICCLPASRLTHVLARLDVGLVSMLPALHHAGYADMGLAPASGGGWYWMLQRGYRPRALDLICPIARALNGQANPPDSPASVRGP